MAVEVRLPTVLRTHAGGASVVTRRRRDHRRGPGASWWPSTRAWPGQVVQEDGSLHKFVNIYVERRRRAVPRRAWTRRSPTGPRSRSCRPWPEAEPSLAWRCTRPSWS